MTNQNEGVAHESVAHESVVEKLLRERREEVARDKAEEAAYHACPGGPMTREQFLSGLEERTARVLAQQAESRRLKARAA